MESELEILLRLANNALDLRAKSGGLYLESYQRVSEITADS